MDPDNEKCQSNERGQIGEAEISDAIKHHILLDDYGKQTER
ncbi:unnamed protein product [marine sediment metagenome]|uniref:Uncharacterized protein n=1 Tax=marine sediment metagenome TaxID=412755 RepID=X0WT56_9ZZZZ